MVAPPTVWKVTLTGRTRHRSGMFGKQILQVEERHAVVRLGADGGRRETGRVNGKWRDATFEDVHALGPIPQLRVDT